MRLDRWFYAIGLRLRSLFMREQVERELAEEFQYHIERKTEEYMAAGMSPAAARHEALRAMDGIERHKEECRDMRRVDLIDNFLQDARYALRTMRKRPGFAIVTVITLALGIGANTAIFSIVNGVLLRSLPYRDPDRLVKIVFNMPGIGLRDVRYSVPELDDLNSRASIFEDVSVTWSADVNLTGAKEPDRLEMIAVSPGYFSMLGANPQIGRLFGPQDSAPGFAEAIVISDALWSRSFGRDPGVLGRSVLLDNDLYTIVGVLPAGFRHPGKTIAGEVELWTTAGFVADPFPKPARNVRLLPGAIGRLKPGVSQGQAQARLNAFAAELRNDYPNDYTTQGRWSVEIEPLQQSLVGSVRPMLLLLMGAVLLIVLIAAVNVANLLLARASGRQREVAMRLALGAGRSRIVRQMLTESLILSSMGGLAGLLAAKGTLSLMLRFVPSNVPRLNEVSIDWVVLGFALGISVAVGLAFGLVPAIQSARADVNSAIREGGQGAGFSRKTGRTRDILIVSELALAVVLMVGAGLLLRTFWTLLQQNPGFNPSGVVTAGIWLPVPNDPKADPYAKPESLNNFARETLRRVGGLPGIEMAGLTTSLPGTETAFNIALTLEDSPVEASEDLAARVISVSPDYFRLMQATLESGRYFGEADDQGKDRVAVVDETAARRYWPGRDAIGSHLKLRPTANVPWMTVVGVIKDIKHEGLDARAMPHVYTSLYQLQSKAMSLVARTSLPASAIEQQIRREVQAIDPNLPLFNVRPLDEVIGVHLAPRRFSAELVGAFAALALLLASVGIYGLLAYMVGQRRSEIGVRVALGAQRSDIRRLVLRRGALLAGSGVAIGLVLSAATAPAIAALLYGVRPIDPVVFLAAPAVLGAVALLASYIPARRAARVDPIAALRQE
jgi:predicted permease